MVDLTIKLNIDMKTEIDKLSVRDRISIWQYLNEMLANDFKSVGIQVEIKKLENINQNPGR
ncbi:MAG: hypothetical protein LBB23_00620 [Rickettsiales bacterium]|jgi:ABC-type transport system substrate-binding protein|nr:hypothetical protein [Rickettsiales bacterium]